MSQQPIFSYFMFGIVYFTIAKRRFVMPRRARITAANIAHHIIQRGNNRSACFYAEDDYLLYLEWLHKYALERECQIHAYVLMTNHVHLLVTPADRTGLAGLMKSLGQRYVLGCYRYIELNPVRACMDADPDSNCML
jgi:putative transposase